MKRRMQPAANEISQESAQDSAQDSAWKDLLDHHFEDFLRYFFPTVAAEVDWTRAPVFLDKELVKLSPRNATGARFADKLAQVWLRNGASLQILLHSEVQGRARAVFNRRMYVYNYRITDRYELEVVSLGVVTGSAGRTQLGRYETARWGCRLIFEFPVVNLADWRGREAELAASAEPFALVVLAQLKVVAAGRKLDRQYAAKQLLLELLLQKGYRQKYAQSLLRFIDWLYQLPPELEQRLNHELETKQGDRNMPYVTSWERRGQQRGEVIGEERGERKMLLRLLVSKFGAISPELQAQIEGLPSPKLGKLAEALLAFTKPADLERWLKRHASKKSSAAA